MVIAIFGMKTEDGTRINEPELPSDKLGSAALFHDIDRVEGRLRITDPDTGAICDVGDVMPILMGAFCLGGLDALRRDGHVTVDFFDHEQLVDLKLEDGRVTISGGGVGPASFDAPAYFVALRECGARYVAMLELL